MTTCNWVSVDEKTFHALRDLIFGERGKLQPDVADVEETQFRRTIVYFYSREDAVAFQDLCATQRAMDRSKTNYQSYLN